MTDTDLQASVTAELIREPQIDSDDIAVSADRGVITLRGTVTSLRHKNQAHNTARRVDGVRGVANQLLVRLTDCGQGADADLRATGERAIALDGLIPRQRAGPGR
jgi:hypothetical protein